MNNKYTCFIVTPMGETSPDTQRDYNLLLDFGIKPALERLGFIVRQGEFQTITGQVDESCLEQFRNADLCVIDINDANSTDFYYELGKRTGREKPTVLLKSATARPVPFLDTSDFITYDLSDRYYLPETQSRFTTAVEGMLHGVLNKQSEVTLFSINDKLDRMIQSISHLLEAHPADTQLDETHDDWSKENPRDLFKYAIVTRDTERAEFAMDKLKSSMDQVKFYDIIVEQAAMLGSHKAGQMLIDSLEWFMGKDVEITKKIEYLGVLVSYLNKNDIEFEHLARVENVAKKIMEDDSNAEHAIHNQLNRLYYGIYRTKKNAEYLDKAIEQLEKAIALESDEPSYYYNLAMCYLARSEDEDTVDSIKQDDFNKAVTNIRHCLDKQGDRPDADHLVLACRILRREGDIKWKEYFDTLRAVSKMRYEVLKAEFDREDKLKRVSKPKDVSATKD